MELISIETATRTAVAGVIDLNMTVNLGDGELSNFPFTYNPADMAPMSELVATYLASHPELIVADYVAPAVTDAQVDAERDRRIALPLAVSLPQTSGDPLTFSVNMDDSALRNMNGLATGAVLAKVTSNTATTPFITFENTTVNLSPDDLINLGLQVQTRISAITFAGRAIKDTVGGIPLDYKNDSYWT